MKIVAQHPEKYAPKAWYVGSLLVIGDILADSGSEN